MSSFSLSRWCGMLATVLGLELIAGWLLQVEAMVRIVPSSNSVSFNTAVALVLAGTALMARQKPWQIKWRKTVAVVLVIGASLILFEDLADIALGLDWESLHRTVADGSPRPGRVAPNTCTSLLLLGLAFWFIDREPSASRRLILGAFSLGQTLLIGTGVVGLLLDPTLMFGWYKFNRMAAPTALGLALLTLGMYARQLDQAGATSLPPRQQEGRILIRGTLVLLGMGMAGALTTFIIFANYQQNAIRDKLHAELISETRLAEVMIDQSTTDTGSLVSRPLLLALVRKVAKGHEPASQAILSDTLAKLLGTQFSSMALRWSDGAAGIQVGKPIDPVELALPLRQPATGTMLWGDRGFVYRISTEITDESGQVIGYLTTERRLGALSNIYKPALGTARSAEIVICGNKGDSISCFPSRLHPTPLHLLPAARRTPLPVDDAMAGKSDVRNGTDYRGRKVVAAYSQIGMTGLAVVSKVDAVELYEPINFLLSRSIIVLAISLGAGFLLLRRLLAPLVKSIVASERVAKISEGRAIDSEHRLKSIADNVPALIASIDENGVYRFANATYERWFGIPAAHVIGKKPHEVLDNRTFQITEPHMRKALAGEIVQFSYKTDGASGAMPAYVSASLIPDRDENGRVKGFNVLAFDTTEQHDHQQALAHLAYHDSLTELPNRRLFHDRLQQALTRARRQSHLTALMYLDIDRFKQINDTLGHDCGDLLLRAFALRLRQVVRSTDTVARLGGDEFTIIMESVRSEADAGTVAEKILNIIRAPFDLDGKRVDITTSIGISFSDGQEVTVDTMLQNSDEALYAAKAAGRNRYYIHEKHLA